MWTLIDDSVGILAGTMLKINPLDLEIMVRLKKKKKPATHFRVNA